MSSTRTVRCLLLTGDVNAPKASVETLSMDQLPAGGGVLVRVLYSALNYKDALAVTGRGRVIRGRLPFVPGIDLVGEVLESAGGDPRPGDTVIATGWGLGEVSWGGYSEYQWLRPDQLIPLPPGMDPEVAMTAGTAGLTAMLATMAVESGGVRADGGEVLVTGASGGVGSLSVLFLSELGYSVTASTGKPGAETYLRQLGASAVIDRAELASGPTRPLESARWSGAVDSVGGETLAAALSQTGRHGVVACCGLVGGETLNTTVFPFILRGVRLVGIDSNTCPAEVRVQAWSRIARSLRLENVHAISRTIRLEDVVSNCDDVMHGRVTGRLVVRIGDVAR